MTAAPLSAAGISIRPASLSSQPRSPLYVARLVERLEAQLEEEERRGGEDPWGRVGIAVGLSNAGSQLDSLALLSSSSSYSSETSASVLRARLQRAVDRYNALDSPLSASEVKWGSHLSNPLLAPRQYLAQGLMEESDSEEEEDDDDDDDYDDEQKDARALRGPDQHSRKGHSQKLSNEDEDEELAAYEAAAHARNDDVKSPHSSDNRDGETEAKPTALQSERSIQDSLSGELLRMAGILKANSMAFADALERDRRILEEAGEKLQGNLTLMTRTRGKLGEYSRKARGMGWLTLGSVAVVCMSWVVMFVLIRLT